MSTTKPRGKANVRKLVEQRDLLLAQIEALRNQVQGIEMAIGLLDSDAVGDKPDAGKRSPVKSTLLGLLGDAGTTGLTPKGAVEMAFRRGIKLDPGTTSSTLSRLKREGAIVFDGTRYKLPQFDRPAIAVVK